MTSLVNHTLHDDIAVVQWDDGKANAVSPALIAETNAALDVIEQDAHTAAVVLTGRPGKFCAGFDLSVMAQGGSIITDLVNGGAELACRLLMFPKPVVIAANGHALAMGGLLLLAADWRLAEDGPYKIGLTETRLGMVMPQFGIDLARFRCPPTHVERSVLHAEMFSPQAAIAAGFIDATVAADALLPAALSRARELSQLPAFAFSRTKRKLHRELVEKIRTELAADLSNAGK